MKGITEDHPGLDASSLVGIVAGTGLLFTAGFVPDLELLAIPAFVLLLLSLLFGMR